MNEIPKHDIKIKQGGDYSIDFIYTDDDENPIDLTNWTIFSHIRQTPQSYDYFPFTCSADENGIHLSLSKELTDEITFSKGFYDVFITDPNNEKRTPLIQGEVTIIPRSTR